MQPAPIPEWQNDDRRNIRIGDIMRMSSGIRIVAPQDPGYTEEMGYPDHLYLYTGENAFEWAATARSSGSRTRWDGTGTPTRRSPTT